MHRPPNRHVDAKRPCHDGLDRRDMTGDNDQLIPCANSKIIADQIPNAKLVELENSSHIFTTDQTEKSVAAILEFLGNN